MCIRDRHKALGPLRDRLVGVGVAAPFQLGGWHRMLGLSDAQSEDWNQIDLRAQVQAMTDAPVSFAKDTSAACVAELVAGRGRDLKNFLYLFVDTFVGGGLVINSHLHGGLHGNAGAVASLPLGLAPAGGTDMPAPEQLISHASLWELEQRFIGQGLDLSLIHISGIITATSQQYPLKMASMGVAAGVDYAKTGKKATGYVDTGVTLIAKNAIAGVDSKDTKEGLAMCWGTK